MLGFTLAKNQNLHPLSLLQYVFPQRKYPFNEHSEPLSISKINQIKVDDVVMVCDNFRFVLVADDNYDYGDSAFIYFKKKNNKIQNLAHN